jgi:hypothetical protein
MPTRQDASTSGRPASAADILIVFDAGLLM